MPFQIIVFGVVLVIFFLVFLGLLFIELKRLGWICVRRSHQNEGFGRFPSISSTVSTVQQDAPISYFLERESRFEPSSIRTTPHMHRLQQPRLPENRLPYPRTHTHGRSVAETPRYPQESVKIDFDNAAEHRNHDHDPTCRALELEPGEETNKTITPREPPAPHQAPVNTTKVLPHRPRNFQSSIPENPSPFPDTHDIIDISSCFHPTPRCSQGVVVDSQSSDTDIVTRPDHHNFNTNWPALEHRGETSHVIPPRQWPAPHQKSVVVLPHRRRLFHSNIPESPLPHICLSLWHRASIVDSPSIDNTKVHQANTSRPPQQVETDNEAFLNTYRMIVNLQGQLRDDTKFQETVKQVQGLLLRLPKKFGMLGQQRVLIIGVDSTPVTQAGYCVNLQERSLQYYVVKRNDFPWLLRDEKDTSEFEMKNMIFALTLWNSDILKHKRMRLYTDNFALQWKKEKYGSRAARMLNHLMNCKGVFIANRDEMAINRFQNLKDFAMCIQPADDLSRWNITEALKFLSSLYQIDKENIYGTHFLQRKRKRKKSKMSQHESNGKPWYIPNANYQSVLDKVTSVINDEKCLHPSCANILQLSLRVGQQNKL